jgi:hypothetical protein
VKEVSQFETGFLGDGYRTSTAAEIYKDSRPAGTLWRFPALSIYSRLVVGIHE